MNKSDSVLPRADPVPSRGGSDDVAHIVTRRDQMIGYLAGEPIEALCGRVWVPTRDYEGLPVSQACTDERERIVAGIKGLN